MIADALRKLTATNEEIYSVVGTVKAVDEAARTCDVQPINEDAELLDIRLQAVQNATEGAVMIPKVGSWVVVSFTSKADGFVSLTSTVDKILWKVGGQELAYSKDGLKINSDTADLKEQVQALFGVIDDLLTTLQTFTLSTNVGPTLAVMPPTITNLTKHQTDLAGIKQKIETILN